MRGSARHSELSDLLIELLITKIYDETRAKQQGQFYFRVVEGENSETTKARIVRLCKEAWGKESEQSPAIEKQKADLIQKLVRELQSYKLGGSQTSV